MFVALPEGRAFVEGLWDESAATLSPPSGLDIALYRDNLMARFANSMLAHRTRQIAMDGSQKLPQRLVAPLLARRAAGEGVAFLVLAVAAWMRWQSGLNDGGGAFVVDDPLAGQTAAALAGLIAASDRVNALIAIEAIFPRALAQDSELIVMLGAALAALEQGGALPTIRSSQR